MALIAMVVLGIALLGGKGTHMFVFIYTKGARRGERGIEEARLPKSSPSMSECVRIGGQVRGTLPPQTWDTRDS